jgi:S-adenosyl-L-methionine hydrolase (adenosine-forming)
VARPVLFLTDYGLQDEFVGLCHAVIARLAPEVRVIDLTHGIPPLDVGRGAMVLADAVPHAPADAVYLAVVDPGVGTERRAVAVSAGDALLVGPDNGLLAPAWEALGGAAAAVSLRVPEGASATFHGRDVFAPAAARLAAGEAPEALGEPLDPATLVRMEEDRPRIRPGEIRTRVAAVDRFGNVALAVRADQAPSADLDRSDRVAIRAGSESGARPVRRVRTFGDLGEGEIGVLVDSAGRLAVVQRGGSAAASLGLGPGDPVVIARPPG